MLRKIENKTESEYPKREERIRYDHVFYIFIIIIICVFEFFILMYCNIG